MAAPRPATPHVADTLATLSAFETLGIAVFPEKLGRKGSRVKGWPSMPVTDAHALSRVRASGVVAMNLAARTGDGFAVLDLDAKGGVDPDRMLALVRVHLEPAIIAIVKTPRGYHIWLAVEVSVGGGYCSAIGGEVFSEPHLAMVPPSLHPSGHKYVWVVEPRRPAGKADLASLGLIPDEPSGSRGESTKHDPAPAGVRSEFEALMMEAGIRPGRRLQEVVQCAWHEDRGPSLSINWEKGLFHCFGASCGVKGGVESLRKLLGHTPSYRQREPWLSIGDKLGCVDEELERLAAALEKIGPYEKARALRDCREVFAVGRCTGCPALPAFPVSCGFSLCPRCMPGRFAADWLRHRGSLPERLNLVRLLPRDLWGISPEGMLKRARNRFREWRCRSGIAGGIYGLRLDAKSGAAFLLALPAEVPIPGSTRAFEVELVAEDRTPESCLHWLQAEYAEEARSWQSEDDLVRLLRETRARRRFQGFGDVYGSATETALPQDGQSDADEPVPAAVSLGRISGGSNRGVAKRDPRLCPFCGARVEMYDFKVRLEDVRPVGRHWRWRGAAAARRLCLAPDADDARGRVTSSPSVA